MKKVIQGLTVLAVIILLFLFRPFFSAREALSTKVDSSDDTTLFDFYAHFYSDKKYDELLRELIAGQRNLGVLTVLGKYAKFNRKCELMPDLVASMNFYKKIPRDSVWEVQISHNYKKFFSTEMLYWHGGHFEDVELLQELCKKADKSGETQQY